MKFVSMQLYDDEFVREEESVKLVSILRAGTIAGYKPAITTYREEKRRERKKRATDL